MTTITLPRKRPEHAMSEVVAAEPVGKPYNKRFTSMKAVETEADTEKSASMLARPSDEELDKINQFTQTPKTADEVVVLRTMSANDIRDRDLDMFKTACIKKFASLPAPYSSVGKSFMVGHDTTKLPMGRIFDVGTKRQDDNLFLTHGVYMPNTEQYQKYLENVDFGIYWAVSVGVMIGETTCTVGATHAAANRWYCSQGHEKGLFYDPSSEEKDSWGWPMPVEEGAKNAVQCGYDFDEPTDFYELSQVYLGAQYFAELGKSEALSGVIKAASTTFPVVGLRAKEADTLPISHIPQEVAEARRDKLIIPTQDGSYRWQDEQDFIYTYDAAEGEVLCLGKAAKTQDKLAAELAKVDSLRTRMEAVVERWPDVKAKVIAKATDDTGDDDESPVEMAEAVDATLDSLRTEFDQVSGADDDAHFQQADDLLTSAETAIDELVELLGGDDPDDNDDDDSTTEPKGADTPMSKKVVQAAAREAKMPSSILDKLAEAEDDNALGVLVTLSAGRIAELDKQVKESAPMVEAGTKYLDDLRTEVKAAYVRAKQVGEAKGVSTDRIERLISLAGNDIELLKGMLDDYEAEVTEKVGSKAVIRSSFPVDANKATPSTASDTPDKGTNGHVQEPGKLSLASRLHR